MNCKPGSRLRVAFLLSILLLTTLSLSAQFRARRSGDLASWEIGISGGASKFLKTINPNADAVYKTYNYWNADINPALTLSITKNFSPKFALQLEYLTTKFSGTWNVNNPYNPPPYPYIGKDPSKIPGFKTGINQLLAFGELNTFKIFAPRSELRWYLYLRGGGGVAFLKAYEAAFYYTNIKKFSLGYGGGLAYQINDQFKLKIAPTWYVVYSDRLDGMHTTKIPGKWPTGVDKNDYFFNTKEKFLAVTVGVTYGLGQKQSKAHFIRSNNQRNVWFKPSKSRYKRYRRR